MNRRLSVVFLALALPLMAASQPGCPGDAGPYECAKGAALTGFIQAAKGATVTGKYIVVLKPGVPAFAPGALGFAPNSFTTSSFGPRQRMIVGSLVAAQAKMLAADARVQFVQEETVKTIQGFESTALDPAAPTILWGLDRIDQRLPPLDDGYTASGTGEGVDVCIVDTGVDPNHPAIKPRLVAVHSAFGGDTADAHGHGTHVAATATDGRRYGVSAKTALLGCRCLNADGSGTDSSVINCIDWCAEMQRQRGRPMALNMSLGGPVSPALDAAVCRAVAQGVVVVVAAGNSAHSACDGSPSRVDLAFTIGATDKPIRSSGGEVWWETRSDFSNYGKCVDLFAPGRDVLSARKGDTDDNDPVAYSGTSMASPHVCGAAALCLERGEDAAACLVSNATKDALAPDRIGDGSPNLFLFAGQ